MSKRKKRRHTSASNDQHARTADAHEQAEAPQTHARPESEGPAEAQPSASNANADATAESHQTAQQAVVPATEYEQVVRQRDAYLELAQRARADLENYRKRVSREREQDEVRAQALLLRELLAPLDDLDRAFEAAERERDFDVLVEGLRMVREDLWKALRAHGFERIGVEPGSKFDPAVHEAMAQTPHPQLASGAIVEEHAPGYRVGELVLRPSRVVVSSGPPKTEEPPAADQDDAEEQTGPETSPGA